MTSIFFVSEISLLIHVFGKVRPFQCYRIWLMLHICLPSVNGYPMTWSQSAITPLEF